MDRSPTREPFRMLGEGLVEGALTHREDLVDTTEVDVGRGEIGDATVSVFVVVPAEEVLEVAPGGLVIREVAWVGRVELGGLELGLGVRVVVGDPRPAEAGDDSEVGIGQRERARGQPRIAPTDTTNPAASFSTESP